MRGRLDAYTILCVVCVALGISVVYITWLEIPLVDYYWTSIIWFAIFTALSELLPVRMDAMIVTPTIPILWAAICVLGPIPAMISAAIGSLFSQIGACYSYHALQKIENQSEIEQSSSHDDCNSELSQTQTNSKLYVRILRKLSASWIPAPIPVAIKAFILFVSQLILCIGLAGIAYYLVGGRFLISEINNVSILREFVLPFCVLVCVQILIECIICVIALVITSPMPGTRGVYGLLLRAKIALIEGVFPVLRGEMFLIVVSLLIAYLYANIGIVGFILAALPVLALRDFFYQWVQERSAYLDTVTTLATYMQHYHPYTRGHLKRVADMSERLARELRLPAESVRHMRNAGFLHDIGKVGVSEEILDKTEKLTNEEWEKIKEHPVKGAEIISHIEFLEEIVDWIRYHHKWHDGGGYPANNGANHLIPIEAAIISVADAFDAMTDDRELTLSWKCDSCGYNPEADVRPDKCPMCGAEKRRTYRTPKSLDDAINELRRGAGSQFHPRVVKAFLSMVEREGIHLNA